MGSTIIDVRQFKAALKKILVRTSIRGNKYGNCSNLESGCNEPIFSLTWKKSATVLEKSESSDDDDFDLQEISSVIDEEQLMSVYKENILAYIGGYIVKKLISSIKCSKCVDALIETNNRKVYYLNLINIKDNGGLVVPSRDVVKILKKCEAFFVAYVSGGTDHPKISTKANVKGILANKIQRELFSQNIFQSMLDHDFDNCFITEDLHSTQLTKKVIDYYLRIRFFRYGQRYSSVKLKKDKYGLRQQANKMVLFQGL